MNENKNYKIKGMMHTRKSYHKLTFKYPLILPNINVCNEIYHNVRSRAVSYV